MRGFSKLNGETRDGETRKSSERIIFEYQHSTLRVQRGTLHILLYVLSRVPTLSDPKSARDGDLVQRLSQHCHEKRRGFHGHGLAI